jgi:hypothetical protein
MPCGPALGELEVARGAHLVVLDQGDGVLTAFDVEPGNQQPSRLEVLRGGSDDVLPIARPAEDHDVAGHRHDVETALELHGCQVGVHPLDGRFRPPGKGQEVVVEIDTDHVNAATAQLDGHATHAATGVEHTARMEALDEIRFSVR